MRFAMPPGRAVRAVVQRDRVRAQRQVGRDAAELAVELLEHAVPELRVDEQAVDEDDGRLVAGRSSR